MIAMTQDNVLLRLEKLEEKTASGIIIADFEYDDKGKKTRRNTGTRTAVVVSVGPGHYAGCRRCGGLKKTLLPTTVKEGERVLIPALAGQDYTMDVTAPRHHTQKHEFADVPGLDTAEYRIVREAEIFGVLE